MFKEKATKKRITTHEHDKDAATLDARHQQMIQAHHDRHQQLEAMCARKAALLSESARLKDCIHTMKACDVLDTPEYDRTWGSNLSCDAEIRRIQQAIDRLCNHTEEIEYYQNTGKILFQYYDLLENHDQGASAIPVPMTAQSKGRKKAVPILGRNILDALNIHDPGIQEEPAAADATSALATPSPHTSAPATMPRLPPPVASKTALVDEYMLATDPSYLPNAPSDEDCTCSACHIPLLCLQSDGIMVCPTCGYQELLLVEQNRALVRPAVKEASHMSYKRINHFREWCSQVQGKESTDIPEDVFERILAEIKKEKILDVKRITYAKMREILKKLKINKYYEHIHYIMHRITGIPPPHFSPELEEKLCSMFKEIQPYFVKHCPVHRKNFLSYSYILHQFFRILGEHDPSLLRFLGLFNLLKSREKLLAQDKLFKLICDDLGWPFFPSL